MVFPEYFPVFAGGLLQNGMTAILLTLLTDLTAPRASRFRGRLDIAELPGSKTFPGAFATRSGWWDAATAQRLAAASQETLPGNGLGDEAAGRRNPVARVSYLGHDELNTEGPSSQRTTTVSRHLNG